MLTEPAHPLQGWSIQEGKEGNSSAHLAAGLKSDSSKDQAEAPIPDPWRKWDVLQLLHHRKKEISLCHYGAPDPILSCPLS